MDIHFVAPDLRRLDQLQSEALVVSVFADERPPRGLAGLVDWRLCGLVSQLLIRGRIGGETGEATLIPPRPRLPFDKLFLIGAGDRSAFDEQRFDSLVMHTLQTLEAAHVRTSVWMLPGRGSDLIAPGRAMERFLSISADRSEPDDVTLVEASDAQKAMLPIVERQRRRARALAD